jgi:hypothetical protein
MNLPSSLRALANTVSESRAFRRVGPSPFWLFRYHYHGRWNDRWSRPAPEQVIELLYRGRSLRFPLTTAYLGALKGIFLDDEYARVAPLRAAAGAWPVGGAAHALP